MTASSMAISDDDTNGYGNGDVPVELLDDLRTELEEAADDISRLTERLRERTVVVERLETLVAEVLAILPTSVVVVDVEGRIVALSQGAVDDHRGTSEDALGQPASAVLPSDLADDIVAVGRAAQAEHRELLEPPDDAEGPTARWADVSGAKVLTLPGGWVLAVLST